MRGDVELGTGFETSTTGTATETTTEEDGGGYYDA